MNEKKTKLVVGISLVTMIILSLVVAYIMAGNLGQDTSKLRFKLTKDYKKYKDYEYTYTPAAGKKVYMGLCSRCHGPQGLGTTRYPSLKNEKLLTDQTKLIKIILHGLKGEINRDGKVYNGAMPGFKNIPHDELAHVINYMRKNFGGIEQSLHPVEVVKGKIDFILKKGAYTSEELGIKQ